MSIKQKNVPRLRFPEFTGEWGRKELLDYLVQPISDGPHETPQLVENGIPFISVDAIVNNQIDFSRKRGDISEEYDLECRKKYSPQKNDVFLVKSGSTVGKVALVDTDMRFNIWSPLAAMRTDKSQMCALFLYYVLQTESIQKEVLEKSKGGTQPNLSMRILEKFQIKAPALQEQMCIVSVLKNFDTLITLQQRKLDQIKEYKKGMLQKMFPKEGESVPDVRFPGFTGEWERRKLGDVLEDLYNGQTPSRVQTSYWNGDINWLTSGELNRGIVYTCIERITKKGQESAHLRIIPRGTFVMAITGLEASGTRGNCAILGIDTTLNQSCMALMPDPSLLSTRFLFQWYKMVGEEYGTRFTQGTKQQSYNAEIIKSLDIVLPSVKEQEQISDVLVNLDNLISLHQRKLDAMKEYKKGLLQQMFV